MGMGSLRSLGAALPHSISASTAVARPLILRITISGASLALIIIVRISPTVLARDNANLWPLIIRICEQAAWTAKLNQGRPIG
jgi:hypothetical protein